MSSRFEARLAALTGVDLQTGSRRGIEKESLRVTADGHIASTPHPRALGSALTHPYITTDFSEALIELITPPVEHGWESIQFLCELHQYVYQHLGEEVLWAMSMPCTIRSDDDIPLARYGDSNIGRMKTVYRRGLSYRYGRYMQAISGIHYNYSPPERIWPLLQDVDRLAVSASDFRSASYLGLVRNVRRLDWLLLYLFGASPAVCRSFLKGRNAGLEPLGDAAVHGPFATSLRMSDLGYHNTNEARLQVSANSLDEYIADLDRAIRTESPAFAEIGVRVDGVYRQLNTNQLQIENEYYSTIRPKRVALTGERPTSALRRGGIEYVELRALDVNPFDPVGINSRTGLFIEAFLLYCLLADSPVIDKDEAGNIAANHALVARRGREPGLQLLRGTDQLSLADWGREILTGVLGVAELLDAGGESGHADAVHEQRRLLDDASLTPSARLLADLGASGESLATYGMRLSQAYASYFRALAPELNQRRAEFEHESAASLDRQAEIEAADSIDFDSYLQRYFA